MHDKSVIIYWKPTVNIQTSKLVLTLVRVTTVQGKLIHSIISSRLCFSVVTSRERESCFCIRVFTVSSLSDLQMKKDQLLLTFYNFIYRKNRRDQIRGGETKSAGRFGPPWTGGTKSAGTPDPKSLERGRGAEPAINTGKNCTCTTL